MSRRRLVTLVAVVAILGVVTGVIGVGIASGSDPGLSINQYSAKFVCGFQPADEFHEYPVKPGNYATVINIHNPNPSSVRGDMQVALSYSPGQPVPPIIGHTKITINKRRTLAIDCPTIWTMVGVPPGTLIEGMLHIGLPFELPVAAVYTSQTDTIGAGPLDPGTRALPDPGAGISIDVEYLVPIEVIF